MVLYPRSNSLHMCYLSLLVGILMDELWRIYISSQCPCSSALRGPTDPHQNSPNYSASPACSTCCDALPVEETLFQHGAARMVAECGLGSLHRHGAQIPTLNSTTGTRGFEACGAEYLPLPFVDRSETLLIAAWSNKETNMKP